jgi:hypothetical protein
MLIAWLVDPKIISSTYIWHTNNSPFTLFVKRVESINPIWNPFSLRNAVR